MQRSKNRVVSFFMCLILLCTLIPWFSLSVSANTYNGSAGDNVRYILDPDNKCLVFTGTGETKSYSQNADDLPGYATGLVSVNTMPVSAATSFNRVWFGEGITKIGRKAIPDSCSNVHTVVIGSTVKSCACDLSRSNITKIICYSPDFVFNFGINRNAIITGYAGSTAEKYANDNDIDFYPFSNGGGNCYATGSSLRWDLDISDFSLTISGAGDMIDYSAFYLVPWVERSSQITTISLSDEMTHIGDNAFNYCPYFTQITIPESVTSIGKYAFAHCTGLSTITIPSGVESIGTDAFEGSNIPEIYILSENCDIFDASTTLGNPKTTVIHGYGYSTAKTYAEKYGYTFVPIECEEGRHEYATNKVPAVCLSDGYTEHTCEYCGDSFVTDKVGALGHDLGEWIIKTEATCTEDGEKERFCSRCDYSETETIDASGHDFGEWVIDPQATCTSNGTKTRTCKNCDEKETETIYSQGHQFGEWETTTPATCTEDGEMSRSCSACGETETETLKASGHSFGEWITVSEVSCTVDGYRYRICSECPSKEEETTKAYGHDFPEWNIEKETSCTEDGLKSRVCARCGERDEETIPATGHDYSAAVIDATCTEDGYTSHKCNRCGDEYVDGIVEALGHNYEATTEEATCLEDGYTEHVCYRCGDTYRDAEEPALGHDYEAVKTEPTCTAGGFTTHTCRRCGDVFTDEQKAALGHDWDNGVVTVPASQFSAGTKLFTCTRCGETREENIPQLSSCDGGDGCPTADYLDVPGTTSWAHEGIDFCVHEGLMGSTKTNALTFEPNTPTSRAMIVSILYRMEGSPAVSYKATFTDVPAGKWFTDGVIWASENGVVSGYGNGKFGPNDNITREQLASILMRYTNFKGYKANTLAELTLFADAAKIGGWASLSVKWAVGAGIVSGKASGGKTLMDPQGKATRAEVASILMRYIGLIDSLQPLNDPSFCNHKWIVNTSKAATCEGEGNTVYYCTECASAKTETNSPLGHDDVKIDSLEPTCEQAGWNQWRCSRCGRTYKDSKPALGHDDKKTATQAPTCTEAGWNQWTCARCNRSYKDPVAALGHDDVKTVVAPTCTSGGYEQFTCKRCGRSYKQNQTPALGHSFSNGFCIRCGAADPNNPTPSELTAEQVYAKCSPAVFSIYTYDKNSYPIAQGSGFFVSSTGYAVTNSHVVEDAYFVRAVLSDGREIFAEELVVGNYYEDWALLKFPGSGYPFLTMGSSSTIVGGATVYAIGSPEGLSNSISSGIISNPNRYLASDYDVIQITTPISPGSSGGALLNKYGQVIGITSGNLDVSGNDLYYAVPIKYFRDALIANGINVPRYIGVIPEVA